MDQNQLNNPEFMEEVKKDAKEIERGRMEEAIRIDQNIKRIIEENNKKRKPTPFNRSFR